MTVEIPVHGDITEEPAGRDSNPSDKVDVDIEDVESHGYGLEYAQDGHRSDRMLNGLRPGGPMDICWPLMPTTKHLSSDMWDGPR